MITWEMLNEELDHLKGQAELCQDQINQLEQELVQHRADMEIYRWQMSKVEEELATPRLLKHASTAS